RALLKSSWSAACSAALSSRRWSWIFINEGNLEGCLEKFKYLSEARREQKITTTHSYLCKE
ncbi:MAG: hypothetical protein ABL915_06655, partial [Gallionella sp.]